MPKFVKSISFDAYSLQLIDDYMQTMHINNFSQAVCELIKREKRFRNIALEMQKNNKKS